MKTVVSRLRMLLFIAALCGAALTDFTPARADALCHYWSYDACVDTCDRQQRFCARRHADNCDIDWGTCESSCYNSCFDFGSDFPRDRPEN